MPSQLRVTANPPGETLGLPGEMREATSLTQRDPAKKLRVIHVWVHKSEVGDRRVDTAEFLDWCLACDVDADQAFRRLRTLRNI